MPNILSAISVGLGILSIVPAVVSLQGAPSNIGILLFFSPFAGAAGLVAGALAWHVDRRRLLTILGLTLSAIAPGSCALFFAEGGFSLFASH